MKFKKIVREDYEEGRNLVNKVAQMKYYFVY